jgi:hypothetical protein
MKTIYPKEPIFDFNGWIKYINQEVTKLKSKQR